MEVRAGAQKEKGKNAKPVNHIAFGKHQVQSCPDADAQNELAHDATHQFSFCFSAQLLLSSCHFLAMRTDHRLAPGGNCRNLSCDRGSPGGNARSGVSMVIVSQQHRRLSCGADASGMDPEALCLCSGETKEAQTLTWADLRPESQKIHGFRHWNSTALGGVHTGREASDFLKNFDVTSNST